MDNLKRSTLLLIEQAVKFSTPAERGRQLVLIVRDYVEDGDMSEARRVLGILEQAYLDELLHPQAVNDQDVAAAVVVLIEAFGMDFAILARPRGLS